MPLSQFPTTMPAAVAAVLAVADALRHIRDASGDLTMHAINAAQDGLRQAKATTMGALSEGAKAPDAAEAFMAGLGGPATLAEYHAAAQDIEVKAAAWNARVAACLRSLPVESVIGMVVLDRDGIVTRHIEHKSFIPAEHADPLRQSAELAALIGAFEAVGA